MEKQMHLAAQYLAAAGISFLEKKPDDSHTNLGFSTENGCLYTHTLSENGDKLCLDYERFSLEWRSNQGTTSFRLDGATHKEVIKWISDTSQTFLNKKYEYKLHYELPYKIDDTFTYKLLNVGNLIELMHLRILAQFVLKKIDTLYNLNSSIRIWPHHFDTGIYSAIPTTEISIGLGLAIADTVSKDPYLYLSGYKNNSIIDPSGLAKLSAGEWKSDGFTGAILTTNDISESEGVAFFQEAIDKLITK
ncbi:hypothetical protein [Rasiella sp. SM2506]|uniref:hypothetical protein n=1 Tax=Rasiella sp. SM2506 TaxID=3423914 RepID=UPI003D7B302F